MKIYLIKKEKGKKYDSVDVCKKALGFDLIYEENRALGCSISETKSYFAVAIGDCGLEIEEKTRKFAQKLVGNLHKREEDYLSALSFGTSEWNNEFLRIWTAKQAVYKLLGYSFKQMPILDEKLQYLGEIEGYRVNYIEYKGIFACLLAKEEYEIEQIKYVGVSAKPAMSYAADLLAIKAYSSADLLKKLKTKGYNDEESRKTIERLIELGYLDDAEYARRFAENAVMNGKGNGYIKQKLALSGINKDLIPEMEDEFDRAMCLLPSMEGKKPEQIGRRLASLGFSPSTVYKVLGKIR